MANRQVATRDFSWYGQSRNSEENDFRTPSDVEMFRKKEGGTRIERGVSETDSSRKRFTLPIEPTESVDKNREYPPIITVDGSVDTDIDHLMEHPEEEAYVDTPAQDIPSRFPKPHIVRVIDGSLDDDIDNLMNHDGTMAHILVDTPKNLNRGDLKEINSKKSTSPKKDSIQDQADRSFNKITRDDLDDQQSGSELVPYFERNNSSRQIMGTSDADFCHLKESVEQGFCSPPVEIEVKKNNCSVMSDEKQFTGEEPEEIIGDGVGKDTKDATLAPSVSVSVEVEAGMVKDKVIQLEAITSSDEKLKVQGKEEEHEENKEKHQEEQNDEKEDAADLLERLLKMMPKKELERRLGISIANSENVTGTKSGGSSDNLSKADSQNPSGSTSLLNEALCDAPIQDAMTMLRNTLENLSSEMENPTKSESQKMLMVTALKVAGDSMTAAAKMADALSLLVRSNQNKLVRAVKSPSPIQAAKSFDSKNKVIQENEADEIVQSKVRSKSLQEDRKKKPSERQNKSRVPENFKMIGNSHDNREVESDGSNDVYIDRKEKIVPEFIPGNVERNSERFNREKRHRSKNESNHRQKRADEEQTKYSVSRKEEDCDADEERTKEKHRVKSNRVHLYKEELDKKATSAMHRRSKIPKDKRKKSRNAHEFDDFDESPEVKQRHKPEVKERRHERNATEEECVVSGKCGSSRREEAMEEQPWSLPDGEGLQRKGYFDQVVRRLQPYSPPKHYEPPTEEKQLIRAKLVGSCVDPCVRDSDFDSIEFNGNARMSESTLVHYGDEQESD